MRVQPLEHVERLRGVEERAYFVTVVRYELKQREGLVVRVHLRVQLPCQRRLAVVDETPRHPREVTVLRSILRALNFHERLLRRLVIPCRRGGYAVVPVESVVLPAEVRD